MKRIAVLFALLLLSSTSLAHPGRLNAQGCHNDRSTGTVHCHRAAESTPSRPSISLQTPNAQSNGQNATYYQNCAAVRAAGAAPIRRGQPGYGSHLDRDDDGVACE